MKERETVCLLSPQMPQRQDKGLGTDCSTYLFCLAGHLNHSPPPQGKTPYQPFASGLERASFGGERGKKRFMCSCPLSAGGGSTSSLAGPHFSIPAVPVWQAAPRFPVGFSPDLKHRGCEPQCTNSC